MEQPQHEQDEPLLRLAGVSVRFGGFTALDEVDLDVGAHRVVGVVGTNGAGKTTLCDVVSGYARPAAGEVRWRGDPVTGARPKKLQGMGIGRTVQGLGLAEGRSVRDNVGFGAELHARQRPGFRGKFRTARAERDVQARVDAVLHDLRLTDHAQELPPQLSHPLRARVALGRALVGLPALLVLDEPATGLSVEEALDLGKTLRRIARRTSVLLVDHHLELLTAVSDELVVLDAGQVVARTTPAEVARDPGLLAPYTA